MKIKMLMENEECKVLHFNFAHNCFFSGGTIYGSMKDLLHTSSILGLIM